jgi:hypothetical protein
MPKKISAVCSTLVVLGGLSLYSVVHAQNREMARHEPHMSAAMGHLEQARAELEKAAPNKGGYRENALRLIDQAMQQVKDGEVYFQQHAER